MTEHLQACLNCKTGLWSKRAGVAFCSKKCNLEYRKRQFKNLLNVSYDGWYDYVFDRIPLDIGVARLYYEVLVSPVTNVVRDRVVVK